MLDSIGNDSLGLGYGYSNNIAQLKADQTKLEEIQNTITSAGPEAEDEALREACVSFESYFIQIMLKEMRKTVPNDGIFPRSTAEEIFQSMLDEQYSKEAAGGNGIGLAEMLYNQMKQQF